MRRHQISDSAGPNYANLALDAFDGEDIWGLLGYDDAQIQLDTNAGALDSQSELFIAKAGA